MKTIYEQVKELSLPIIQNYHNDLLQWDKKSIESNPKIRFLHFTGNTGTNLIWLLPLKEFGFDKSKYQNQYEYYKKCKTVIGLAITLVKMMPQVNRKKLILYFDGKKLRTINQQKAEEIAEDYERTLRDEVELENYL